MVVDQLELQHATVNVLVTISASTDACMDENYEIQLPLLSQEL